VNLLAARQSGEGEVIGFLPLGNLLVEESRAIGRYVYMRLSSDGTTLGSYFSEDGNIWHMARLYKNDFPKKLLLGLSSQSPKDDAHTCYFTEVSLKQEAVANFRIGKLDGE
jgi:uncharacterized protein